MMDLMTPSALLAQQTAPSGTQQNPTAALLQMLVTFALFGAVIYFIAIRPQQRRAKEQAAMLKSIRAGDKVLTSGGILAVIVTVKEKSLTIRSADSKMEISRSAVAEIIERSGESSAS
jgi:preprotein translocase subunit YajC